MEKIVVYNDTKQFWSEVCPSVKTEETKNSLFLGLAYTYQTNPSDCAHQSALFDQNGKLKGALIVSKYHANRNFLPTPTSDVTMAQKLYDNYKKTEITVTGVIGEKHTAQIYKNFFESDGKRLQVQMAQGIYRCQKVKVPKIEKPFTFRAANNKDLNKIAQWISDFHKEAVPNDPPFDSLEVAQSKINNQMIYVLEIENQLVSMAANTRDMQTSCSVNLVYTPKSYRKCGYGSLVTALLTQHLLNSGKKETSLYTDMNNPTSNKIYMDIGYEFVCDSVHFDVK